MKEASYYKNYHAAKEYLNLESKKVFFQIGTHDGDDAFKLLVEEYQPEKTVLVEPWASLYDKIHESYKDLNYELIEGVVHDNSAETASLYLPDNTLTRLSHATLAPMTDWKIKNLIPTLVRAYNFNDLCQSRDITEIELLMLDTEGYDFIILNSIDFNKIKIKNIISENWGFDTETCYNEYKERDFFGSNGMDNIYRKLSKLNYNILKFESDTFYQLQ